MIHFNESECMPCSLVLSSLPRHELTDVFFLRGPRPGFCCASDTAIEDSEMCRAWKVVVFFNKKQRLSQEDQGSQTSPLSSSAGMTTMCAGDHVELAVVRSNDTSVRLPFEDLRTPIYCKIWDQGYDWVDLSGYRFVLLFPRWFVTSFRQTGTRKLEGTPGGWPVEMVSWTKIQSNMKWTEEVGDRRLLGRREGFSSNTRILVINST